MNRRTACLRVSTLSLTAGILLAASASSASGIRVPLMVTANHLTLDHLGRNLLTANKTNVAALVSSPLKSESFTSGPLHGALIDPHARAVMEALVECALTEEQSVSWSPTAEEQRGFSQYLGGFEAKPWKGEIGLCPQWAEGPASTACQELVSACLLARNNAYGARVDISLQGDRRLVAPMSFPVDPASSPAMQEFARFPQREGAFFGNLFDPNALNPHAEVTLVKVARDLTKAGPEIRRPPLDPKEGIYGHAYVCHPSKPVFQASAYMKRRVCAWSSGASPAGCIAEHVGACHEPMTDQYVCGEVCDARTTQCTYQNCTAGEKTWTHPITVFLDRRCYFDAATCADLEQNHRFTPVVPPIELPLPTPPLGIIPVSAPAGAVRPILIEL
ncbi:hypothetical protein [Sorangium sp. So ce854]|uniref:hypothetical protein n=1 Tax=Sorangium sp. So ce854 TaxID=3133322 RepID=UPI003F617DAE